MVKDLTIIYLSAGRLSQKFGDNIRRKLLEVVGDTPIISVSKQPLDFGTNLVFPGHCSIYNEFKESYLGACAATTKYIAIAEDDSLYCKEHFEHIPREGYFSYNVACWGIYTWVDPPIYNLKNRRNYNGLICERELFIKRWKEIFDKFPTEESLPESKKKWFAEPGRYEAELGVTIYPTEEYVTNPTIIRFSHEMDCWGYQYCGRRKAMGAIRAFDIPHWGKAEDVLRTYYEI